MSNHPDAAHPRRRFLPGIVLVSLLAASSLAWAPQLAYADVAESTDESSTASVPDGSPDSDGLIKESGPATQFGSTLSGQLDTLAASDRIIITETGGRTIVHPDGPPTDSYTIQLASAPTNWVRITITSAPGTPFAAISVDNGVTYGTAKVLVIPAGDVSEHVVLVRWADPLRTVASLPPTARVVTLSHSADSFDSNFDFIDGRNVFVYPELAPTVVDPVDPEDSTESGLAETGAEVLPLTAGGVLLVVLGGALLLFAGVRRRRSSSPPLT